MKNKKATVITYWATVIIIFLFEGVLPAFTSQTALAQEGISHLGYPRYFGNALVVFKVLGALALLLPKVSPRIKEWAYVGFAFDFIFAGISHWAVDGFGAPVLLPVIFLGILVASYISYHTINQYKTGLGVTFQSDKHVIPSVS